MYGHGDRQMTSAELLLHPVRLRIVQAFLGGRELTTADLRDELSDVPTATLYRQVATLWEGGVLEVTEERKIRGTFERRYRLAPEAASVGPEEAAGMTVEEQRRAFLTFVAGLLADFDRYLERGDVDLARDRVGYRQVALYLTDSELDELLAELRAVFATRLDRPAGEGRTRRLVSTLVMPAVGGST
jgi:hypothetical protein